VSLQLIDGETTVEVVHFLAQLTNAVIAVASLMDLVNRRQNATHRRVVIDKTLEAGELGRQVAHLGPVLCRSEQEQDRVEVGLLRNDAVLPQKIGENARMDTKIAVGAIDRVDSRRGEQQLARVDEVLVLGLTGEG